MKPVTERCGEALDWQAFRYVANELTDDERASFEQLLATDPSVCEAVAAAMELTQTIYAAELLTAKLPEKITSARVASRGWLAPLAWVSVGAAACFAVVYLSSSFFAPATQQLVKNAPSSAALAEAWSVQSLEEPVSLSPEVTMLEALDDAEAPLAENHAPGWMLEALQHISDRNETTGTSDEEMES